MTIKELYSELQTSKRPITTMVNKGTQSKLIAVGLDKDVLLSEHKAPGPTKLIVTLGSIEYRTQDYTLQLNELDEFQIPLEEVHSVIGLEPSVFLLSVEIPSKVKEN